jgi:hypothetical protein
LFFELSQQPIALQALAQVDPFVAQLEALFAAVGARLHVFDLLGVCAAHG